MKLVIRSVGSAAHPNLRRDTPNDPEKFAEFVHVDIGTKPGKGADTFTILVATPSGLASLEDRDGIIAQRPVVILRRFDVDVLWRWLEKTVSACEAETWPQSVEKLQHFFNWEFAYLEKSKSGPSQP